MDKKIIEDNVLSYVEKILTLYQNTDNSLIVGGKKINLSRVEIKEVSLLNNPDFYFAFFNSVAEYREKLKKNIENVDFLNEKINDNPLYLESRIKNVNSIFSKIYQYISLKKEKGSVPLIKCINDLLGLRIELPMKSLNKAQILIEDLARKNKWNCRIYNASKNEYKAIHLYLLKDNYSLRWEIQFWLSKDDQSNRYSHAKYKQAYTSWESQYSASDLFEVC